MVARVWGRGKQRDISQRVQSFAYKIWVSSRDTLYSMVTIFNNTVLYTSIFAKSVDIKIPYHKKKITRVEKTFKGEWWVYGIDCGDSITGVYLLQTIKLYILCRAFCMSKKRKKKRNHKGRGYDIRGLQEARPCKPPGHAFILKDWKHLSYWFLLTLLFIYLSIRLSTYLSYSSIVYHPSIFLSLFIHLPITVWPVS